MTIALIIRDPSDVERTVTALQIRDDANAGQDVSALFGRNTANTSELVFNPTGSLTLSVSISPAVVHAIGVGMATLTTSTATATPSGGTAPYTYAWAVVPGSWDGPVEPTAGSPTADATTFTQTGIGAGDAFSAQFTCTVTDSLAATASATVQAIFVDAT